MKTIRKPRTMNAQNQLKNSMSRGNLRFSGDRALKWQKNAITGHSSRLPQINAGTLGRKRKARTTLSMNFQELNHIKECFGNNTKVLLDPHLIDKIEFYRSKVYRGRTARGK